ncbi:MAG: sigma-54-dependent Fis family transcriptional regulator [Polyangiaceae bacterium]
MSEPPDLARVERERDLFLRLLELGEADDVRPYVTQALELLVVAIGAKRGYIEVDAGAGLPPLAAAAHGLTTDDLAGVRARLSQGIIRDAIATGTTVSTASAMEDPRFKQLESVQAQRLRAVLCAPLTLPASNGAAGASIGVIYLEGRARPGPFPESDRKLVEVAARALSPTVERLVERGEQNRETDHTTEVRAKLGGVDLAGTSRAFAEVLRQVLVAAPVPVTVLLRGESGTGKSALARALHASSPRRAGPFVELNVAALPESLFESELFGAEKGAHSTANTRILGKLDAARGGSLLLDEIGELPLAAQAKLLTVLQNKTFMRLGGTTPIQADVRLIAATNANLEEAVRARRFREDLYYRLNVLEIVVPPLRERREDVAVIAEAVAARLAEDPTQRLPLSRAALRALAEAEWPGNVRQLENAIARGWATALSESAPVIEPRHLFGDGARSATTASSASAVATPALEALTFQEATRRFQAKLIEEALAACEWNVSETARRLELSRSHLNDLIRAFGLARRSGKSGG